MTPDQALAKIKKCLAVARGNSEKVRQKKLKRNPDAGHFIAGMSAAEKAQLNRGVGAFAPKGLLT